MEKETLRKKIFAKINNLPALPIVIPKLLSLLEDKETRAELIVDTVSHDPALTSKILQVANSAYYGFPQKITNLERAIALLGFNMVKSLALSIGVIRTLPSHSRNSVFSHEDLWIHSLAVATLMRYFSRKTKQNSEEAETLFIIGLLHDVGKIVFDQFFPEDFQKAIELVSQNKTLLLHDAETRTIGIDHGETGALLLSRWRFPDVIVDPIGAHHQGEPHKGNPAMDVAILRISDALAQQERVGNSGNPTPPPFSAADAAFLDPDDNTFSNAITFLHEAKEGIYAFYNAMR